MLCRAFLVIVPILLVALWARSQATRDSVGYGMFWEKSSPQRLCRLSAGFASGRSLLLFGLVSDVKYGRTKESSFIPPGTEGFCYDSFITKDVPYIDHPPSWHSRVGFDWLHEGYASGLSITYVIVPYWFILLLFTSLVCPWLLAFIRVVIRRAVGRCLVCGYDLRATHKRCPECGATLKNEKTSLAY